MFELKKMEFTGDGARQILVINYAVPTPDRDSGSVRIFGILRIMASMGLSVTFAADKLENDENYIAALSGLGIKVIQGYTDIRSHLQRFGNGYSVAIISLPEMGVRYLSLVRAYAAQAQLNYDTVDLHHIRLGMEAKITGNKNLAKTAEKYRQLEMACCTSADRVFAITENEKRSILENWPNTRVDVIPNIHSASVSPHPWSMREGLVFIGNYNHTPNVDAVVWFVREVLPLIRRGMPGIKFKILGNNPPDSVNSLASHNVMVAGWVPDPAPYFDAARVFVAPLRYGAGMKGKLGQAMSLGLPVVTTRIGAEGMGLEDNVHALIADTPEAFSAAVLRLHGDEALWQRIQRESAAHVGNHFSESAVAGILREILAESVSSHDRKASHQNPPQNSPASSGALLFPVSLAQQGLWFLDYWLDAKPVYNVPWAQRLLGILDQVALERALNEIVNRHQALRTTFSQEDGRLSQVVNSSLPVELKVVNLLDISEGQREEEARRRVSSEAVAPFDLERGPLFRAAVLRLSETEHILVIAIHHIVVDGWSFWVLARELSALYGAYSQGQPSPLPALPTQYANYAMWQREWLQGKVLERQLAYWKAQLSELPVVELPTDRPRPNVPSFRGKSLAFSLTSTLSEGLKALGRRERATLFMVLLAAFQTLLARYTGKEDIAVGSVIAGRMRPEFQGLIGFFVNTLLLRADVSGNPGFCEFLGRVRKAVIGAIVHQHLPFGQLVEALKVRRDLARSPLFQVLLILQNTPGADLQLPGLAAESVEVAKGTAMFDLTMELWETPRGLEGSVEYATDLFDEATIARFIGHFKTLLEGIVAQPAARLSEYPLLTAAERRQVLVDWNATGADYPRDQCVHRLFEAQAAKRPDAVAVVCEGEALSYAEVNQRANRLARCLREFGVRPGDCVATLLERSAVLVVAELAILKCGAAYVPLDPGFPTDRLAFMVGDCASKIVLAAEGAALPVPSGAACVNIREAMLSGAEADNLSVPLGSGAAACVMYTSGSTGQPKGVVVPHRAVGALVLNNGYAKIGADDRVAFAANPAFDAATFEVWAPLLNGGCVVVVAKADFLEPERMAGVIEKQALTSLFITTALFIQYAAAIPGAFGRLRFLLTGGERSDPASFERVLQSKRPRHLIHCYGPTETTTFAATYEVSKVPGGSQGIPIGRPAANTRIYILDAQGAPVPVGVAGELHIGGAGVALGYLNRPDLTAERFLADPFAAEPGARMYKTGDLGRWLADGTVEFLGRDDFQVKIRGFRVELGEIESALGRHPQVREAVLLALESSPGDKRLVAYLTATTQSMPPVSELRDFLKGTLPAYMLPSAYVFLDALPLTPNGKLDRGALPAADRFKPELTETSEAPRTLVEEMLAQIWLDVLGIESTAVKGASQINIHSDFFDSGGHSMAAVYLINKIRDVFQVDLPVGCVFENPDIAGLAEKIQNLSRSNGRPFDEEPKRWFSLVAIRNSGSRRPLFVVPGGLGDEITLMIYAKLLYSLGREQPVYGFKTNFAQWKRKINDTVGSMASGYIKEMRKKFPHGPYLLMGECIGGFLAFEMAQQLKTQGQRVDLILLDVIPPDSTRGLAFPSEWELPGCKKIEDHVNALAKIELKQWLSYCVKEMTYFYEYSKESRNMKLYFDALTQYRPRRYSGPVTFIASSGTQDIYNAHETWNSIVTEGVEFHEIPGDHDSYIGKHIQTTSEKLKHCIDALNARGLLAT